MKTKLAILAVLALGSYSAFSQNVFTGATSSDWGTASNWSLGVVPNLASGGDAQINGASVVWDGGESGDPDIANGGELEIASGSWTFTDGGNWMEFGRGGGTGSLLIDGGTFNQGTISSNPFSIESSSGNTFTITSGAANFSQQVNAESGMTWSFAGGATSIASGELQVQSGAVVNASAGTVTIAAGGIEVNSGGSLAVSGAAIGAQGQFTFHSGAAVAISSGTVTFSGNLVLGDGGTPSSATSWSQTGGTVNVGGELDYNSATGLSMSGGTLNIHNLLTGVNGPADSTFNFSGGIINDLANGSGGWWASSSTTPFNFTLGSTGVMNFTGVSASTVDGWLSSGGIEYNGTIDEGAFTVNTVGDITILELASVPEPSVFVSIATGAMGLLMFRRRKA